MSQSKKTEIRTQRWPNGDEYYGEWRDGSRDGKGTYNYVRGGVYVGDWKRGKHHGTGKYTWPDGDYYEGKLAIIIIFYNAL